MFSVYHASVVVVVPQWVLKSWENLARHELNHSLEGFLIKDIHILVQYVDAQEPKYSWASILVLGHQHNMEGGWWVKQS
jgi:hypothetical protein